MVLQDLYFMEDVSKNTEEQIKRYIQNMRGCQRGTVVDLGKERIIYED